MARVELSGGYFAVVDDEDFERVSRWRWFGCRKRGKVYAVRHYNVPKRKNTSRPLHYEVLRLPQPLPRGFCVDHINRDPLDCRKSNLRFCTIAENNRNRGPMRKPKTSMYKGVSYNAGRGRWAASIKLNRRSVYLGQYADEYRAVAAYNAAAVRLHGRFASLNAWRGPSPGWACPFTARVYARLRKREPGAKAPEGPYRECDVPVWWVQGAGGKNKRTSKIKTEILGSKTLILSNRMG